MCDIWTTWFYFCTIILFILGSANSNLCCFFPPMNLALRGNTIVVIQNADTRKQSIGMAERWKETRLTLFRKINIAIKRPNIAHLFDWIYHFHLFISLWILFSFQIGIIKIPFEITSFPFIQLRFIVFWSFMSISVYKQIETFFKINRINNVAAIFMWCEFLF